MNESEEDLGFGPWAIFTLIFALVILAACMGASQGVGITGAFGVCALIFLSAAAVGGLLGFIFAVPRVISRDGGVAAGANEKAAVLSTNTNLERISDWLTTMLVGVGLSQLTNLNGLLLQFRDFLAETATVYTIGGKSSAGMLPAVGPFILVLGACGGFLFMYLWTRLVLVGFFKHSEDILGGVAVAAIRVAVSGSEAENEGSEVSSMPPELKNGDRPTGSVANGEERVTPIRRRALTASFARASQATTLSNDEALEVMFDLLYQPGGYQRVIQISGELSRTPIAKRADYWFYLAAAFGQQMHHTAEGSDDRLSARDNAIDAAERAVRIDKSFRTRLWEISNPNSTDNDLALLRDDTAFRKLVGRQ